MDIMDQFFQFDMDSELKFDSSGLLLESGGKRQHSIFQIGDTAVVAPWVVCYVYIISYNLHTMHSFFFINRFFFQKNRGFFRKIGVFIGVFFKIGTFLGVFCKIGTFLGVILRPFLGVCFHPFQVCFSIGPLFRGGSLLTTPT